MNTPPVPWGVDTAPLYEAARGVAMESQATTQEIPIRRQCIATSDQFQSTTGVETLEVKNLFDSSQRNDHTCADIEVPHTHSTVQTAPMNRSGSAVESDMESVDISSSDESNDGWSVISDGSDFVVVDSAESTHHHSDARSRKRPSMPKRVSKLHARSRTSKIRPQKMMPSQNEQGMPKPDRDRSSQVDDEGTQRSAGPKDTRNAMDELIERLTEQARALKL
ncbi:hypothetical protein KCU61_g3323, partial [Aureobasidium melanogenum]